MYFIGISFDFPRGRNVVRQLHDVRTAANSTGRLKIFFAGFCSIPGTADKRGAAFQPCPNRAVARIERLRSVRETPAPDFVRTKSGLRDSFLCEASTIISGRFTRDLVKGRGKRAGFAESNVEPNFRHRPRALRQQNLGTLNSSQRKISMRRHAERLLECSGKMKRAELYQLGQQ